MATRPVTLTHPGSPLIPGVNRGGSRADDPDSMFADAEFSRIRPHILKKYDYTCQFCGFRSSGMQDVHHVDGNHRNNKEGNLIVACRLCHLCHHLGFIGARDLGCLLICPDLSQAELNNLVRSLWIGKYGNDSDVRSQSSILYAELLGYSSIMAAEYGFESSLQLANELLRQGPNAYKERGILLQDIKIVFYERGFKDHIQFWIKDCYAQIPANTWVKIAKDLIAA